MLTLLVATHNEGKKREFLELLKGLDLTLVSLNDLGITTEVPETGSTFLENAMQKARGYARLSRMLTMADDSGLEVDALCGEPGVYSARFGGAVSDLQRCQLLLARMQGVPEALRTARFRCVIALCRPEGCEQWTEGVCEGRITTEPQGENGFGYDPIFYLPEEKMTMAELPPEQKNRISHRARAAAGLRVLLEQIIASG